MQGNTSHTLDVHGTKTVRTTRSCPKSTYMQNVRVVDVVDTGDTPTHGKTPYVITPFFAATRAGASCGHDPARPPASWVG